MVLKMPFRFYVIAQWRRFAGWFAAEPDHDDWQTDCHGSSKRLVGSIRQSWCVPVCVLQLLMVSSPKTNAPKINKWIKMELPSHNGNFKFLYHLTSWW